MEVVNKRSLILKWSSIAFALLILFQPLIASAEYEPILNPENAEGENKPGIIEKNVAKLLINVGNFLIDIMKAQDAAVLIFQDPSIVDKSDTILTNTTSADRSNMIYGIFPKGLFDGIAVFHDFFTSLLPIPMVVLLAAAGLMLLFDIMKSNETRSKIKEVLFGIVMVILLIRFGTMVWGWIIDINYWMVDGIRAVLSANGIEITRFTETIWNSSQYSELTEAQGLGTSIMIILAIGMTFTLNYQYMMRLIQLSMLVVLFPIAALSAMIPSRRSVLNLWFTTFASNVFLQTGHAMALGLFFYSLSNAPEIGFWLVMAMMFGLPVMADVVNRIVGGFTGESSGGGGAKTSGMNMSGMAGIMAMSKIGNTLAGGKNGRAGKGKADGKVSSDKVEGKMEGSLPSSGSSLDNSSMNVAQTTPPLSDGKSANTRSAKHEGKQSMAQRMTAMTSSGAKHVAKAGGKLANSERVRGMVRGGTVLGMAGAGAMASTMVTGQGGMGAMVGAQAGKPLSKAGGYLQQKIGKGVEQAGEYTQGAMDLKLGKVDSPFHYTNERLGYTDKAQMIDREEMGRMGEELIGGKTGRSIGDAVGRAGNIVARSSKSPEVKEMLSRVTERQTLGDQLQQSKSMEVSSKLALDNAKKDLSYATASYGPNTSAGKDWINQKTIESDKAFQKHQDNPNDQNAYYRHLQAKEQARSPHPKVQEAQQKVQQHEAVHAKHDYNSRQLEVKQQNFYRIKDSLDTTKQQVSDIRSYQTQHKSSGQI